jgi:hypothetical protein
MVIKETKAMRTQSDKANSRLPRWILGAVTAAAVAMLPAAISGDTALASVNVSEYFVVSSNTQAGAHPDISARFKFDDPGQPEVAKDITVNLPPGIFGNPGAIFKCRAADFALNHCAPGAQVGLVKIVANYAGIPNYVLGTAPVYNMRTVGEEETARIAFVAPVANVPVAIPVSVRSAKDYELQLKVTGIPQNIPTGFVEANIWGFPADPEHDPDRFRPGSPGVPPGCAEMLSTECNAAPFPDAAQTVSPYIDNPSVCTGAPLPITLDVASYQDPGTVSHANATFGQTTGCEKQRFDPLLELAPTSREADSPAGLDIKLKADQFLEGEASSPSTLRSGEVILPPGLTINPDAADGQTACLDSQAGFGTNDAGHCPDNAKIGRIEVVTPALDEPLEGSLYFGEPQPGNQYRVFMIFDGQGIHAKLVASARPNPATGQVTMSVTDLPQVPFEEFNLHLFASDRGLVATPTRCRIYNADSTMTPWNPAIAAQQSSPIFSIETGPSGSSCPGEVRPFHPRLVAGNSSAVAGDFSSFTLKLDRDDGDQFLGDLTFRMPPGFTGDLRGISYCPEASILAASQKLGRVEQANPSCPASSQIGTTNVAAGPGEHPFHAVGKMYLSGPFKGAPLSLAAVTPALAGPYDYGVVVVRVALHVDPETAQVFAASDRVPSIIGGIPIRMRSIQVNIDRPNFTINPTNCSPFTVDSQGIGDQGTVTDFSSYFQVVNCASLAFGPRMTMRQTGGRKNTRRAKNPELQFDLRTRPGDANIKAISVTLSSAFEIDQRHLGNICSEKELAADQCAGRTAIGRATTTTPLLDQPLRGPVYAVSGSGGLPRLAFILNGQVDLVPRADTKTVGGGRLQTTVPVVPDAPIGHFHLVVFGGKAGYLINTRSICTHRPVTQVSFTGQNGKIKTESIRVQAACGKGSRGTKRRYR